MPIPRNNPVWNLTNTLTWLKGKHTWTFGGTFRRTTMYESIGGAPLTRSPRDRRRRSRVERIHRERPSPAFAPPTCPARSQLYALLTGRLKHQPVAVLPGRETPSSTGWARPSAVKRRTSAASIAQDQWRVSPKLTFNYGLRWEFSGAATNPNEVYSSPTLADLFGPSTAVVSAGRAERRRQPADLPAPEAVQRRLQQPGAERRRGLASRQARRVARQAPGRRRLSRQLRRQLLRRGADQLPDGGRQRPRARARRWRFPRLSRRAR